MKSVRVKEMYELQLKMYQNQLELMRKENEVYRALQHDMKHHMVMLADYLHKGETQRALSYLEKMSGYTKKPGNYIETGNAGIDSALNYMIARAEEIGAHVLTDVHVAPGLLVDDFDISIILGNLLLNAAEAMERCIQKKLDIVISYDRGLLSIRIKNTYDGVLMQKEGKIVTRKKDSLNHGRGLTGVKKAVRKYGGDMKIQFDKKEFQVDALLYLIPLSY